MRAHAHKYICASPTPSHSHSQSVCLYYWWCDHVTVKYFGFSVIITQSSFSLSFGSWIKGENLLLYLYMFHCFQVDRLARTDILVKDLYVENACLVAAVQRLEQHCHVLVQMAPDSSSVWIWLSLLQIWMVRVNVRESCYKVFWKYGAAKSES